jgi:hypothetical protein
MHVKCIRLQTPSLFLAILQDAASSYVVQTFIALSCNKTGSVVQWKPLIMITLGLALFDNNNRLITLSEGYKNLHYLAQFIVTVQSFTCIKNKTEPLWLIVV